MKTARRLAFALLSFAAVAAGIRCGSKTNTCVPGQSASCSGANACPGSQVCNSQGTFGACTCATTDAGGGADAGSGSDAGNSDAGQNDAGQTFTCATQAQGICTILQTCEPTLLLLSYETFANCELVLEQQCSSSKANGDNGVVDPPGCLAATTASCDAWFASSLVPPAACKRKTGSLAASATCLFNSQCGSADYCTSNPAKPACRTCSPALDAGTGCATDSDCDRDNGYRCVATFLAGPPPTSDGVPVCQPVTYGGATAGCVGGTNQQCANGFGCDTNNACTALLALGAPCDSAAPLCDSRRGDSCQPGDGGNVCTPVHVVTVGAQCGFVGGVNQTCSAYALCVGAPTTVCTARVPLDAGCTSVPDNCDPGLLCTSGTCQAPAPVSCP